MRRIDPLTAISLVSMLIVTVVSVLILTLNGAAEYWLVAGIWVVSIAVHVRDRCIHRHERERVRREAEAQGAATEARRRAQVAREQLKHSPHAAD